MSYIFFDEFIPKYFIDCHYSKGNIFKFFIAR